MQEDKTATVGAACLGAATILGVVGLSLAASDPAKAFGDLLCWLRKVCEIVTGKCKPDR